MSTPGSVGSACAAACGVSTDAAADVAPFALESWQPDEAVSEIAPAHKIATGKAVRKALDV
jgi:hypothetical protein